MFWRRSTPKEKRSAPEKKFKPGPFSAWNKAASSSQRGDDPTDASNRIFDGLFTPRNLPAARRLSISDPVFTMGSCFAREIEGVLQQRGFQIVSMDTAVLEQSGLFKDEKGIRTGFFHRFNVPSMELEFRRSVEDIGFDEQTHLLVSQPDGTVADLNYFHVLQRLPLEDALQRRRVGKELVSRFRQARAIIMTLGLCEAWFHKPSQHYCDFVPGDILCRREDEFELRLVGYEENLRALENIYRCIERHHCDGNYSLFVTVSPVPFARTFSGQDIVVANCRSKTTLRVVAEEFCATHEKAFYFPSYEIAMYSNPALVWRPDRIHVQPDCVRHITDVFVQAYASDGRAAA